MLSMFEFDTETQGTLNTPPVKTNEQTGETSRNMTMNIKTTRTHKTHMPTQMGTNLKLKQYGKQKHGTKLHKGEE